MNIVSKTLQQPINSIKWRPHIMRHRGSNHLKEVVLQLQLLILNYRRYSVQQHELQLQALEHYVLGFEMHDL